MAGPSYALLCDAPHDDPRVTRIMGYSDEQLCKLARKLNANQGKPFTQHKGWQADARSALIAAARSPVMELDAASTLCEFVGSLNRTDLSEYSIVLGGGMLTLGGDEAQVQSVHWQRGGLCSGLNPVPRLRHGQRRQRRYGNGNALPVDGAAPRADGAPPESRPGARQARLHRW